MPFNALFLLRHAAVHFAAINIGLRHVLDWYVFVERNAGRIDWKELCALAREANMDRFLECLNAICAEDLGLDASLLPPSACDPKLKERVLNEILSPEFAGAKAERTAAEYVVQDPPLVGQPLEAPDRLRREPCRGLCELGLGAPQTSEIHLRIKRRDRLMPVPFRLQFDDLRDADGVGEMPVVGD